MMQKVQKHSKSMPAGGLAVLAALFLACGLPLRAPAASLPDVLRQVLLQHPDVRSSQALLKAAEEVVVQQRSSYYPTVGLTSVASSGLDEEADFTGFLLHVPRNTRTTDAFLRWNLFHGLADRQGVRAAEHDRSASDADLAETHEEVTLDVTEAYLDVLRLRQMIAVGKAYIADQKRLGEDVQKRAQAGRVPPADVDQVLVSLIQAERQQSQLTSQFRAAEQRYRLLTGMGPGEFIEPPLANAPEGKTLAELMDEVASDNCRVRGSKERAAARGEEVGVANAPLSPSLDLEITRRLQSEINPASLTDTRRNNQLQLNYQFPLGGDSISRKRQAVQRREAARATAEATLLRVRTELGQRWENWSEARDFAPRLADRLAASKKVVQAYDLQFESGRRSLLDLLSARSERNQAEIDMIDDHMQQLDASARVLSLLGRLRTTLLGAH